MKVCPRCGREFKRKDNLNTHLKKKYKCGAKFIDAKPEDIIENYDSYFNEYLEMNENILKKKPLKCIDCNIFFKHRNNYYRHKKYRCKKKSINMEDDKISLTIEDYQKMNGEIENLKFQVNESKEKVDELQNQISDIKRSDGVANSNNENVEINGNSNSNINHSTIVNNPVINLLNYSDDSNEILNKKISQNEWINIVNKSLYHSIPALINKKHIDMEEGRYIYIPDLKSTRAVVYKDGKWEVMKLAEVLENLTLNNYNDICDFVDNNDNLFDARRINRLNKMFDKYDKDRHENNKIDKEIKDTIKLRLYNNKNLVKESYKINSGKNLKC